MSVSHARDLPVFGVCDGEVDRNDPLNHYSALPPAANT